MYFQKNRNSEREGGVHDYGILRAWGVMHFGISEGKRGLKHGSCPWLGMDIFWNCPIYMLFSSTNENDELTNLTSTKHDLLITYTTRKVCFLVNQTTNEFAKLQIRKFTF